MPTLHAQVRKSMQTTLCGPEPTQEQVRDLEAFLQTFQPPPRPGQGEETARKRGQAVFEERRCNRCHEPPGYTTQKNYDVGLVDEVGNRTFNPPSLRGVGQGGPFFHDNRARTLEEVFTRYRHELKSDLSEQELEDLLAFLRGL
jgi:cytochrome c peroxidase